MSYPLLGNSPAQLVTQTPVCYLKYSLHVTSSDLLVYCFFHFYLIRSKVHCNWTCFRGFAVCPSLHCDLWRQHCVLLTVPLWSEHDLVFIVLLACGVLGSQPRIKTMPPLKPWVWPLSTREVPASFTSQSSACVVGGWEPVDFVSKLLLFLGPG